MTNSSANAKISISFLCFIRTPLRVIRRSFVSPISRRKLEFGASRSERMSMLCWVVLTQYRIVMDRQTDGRTPVLSAANTGNKHTQKLEAACLNISACS